MHPTQLNRNWFRGTGSFPRNPRMLHKSPMDLEVRATAKTWALLKMGIRWKMFNGAQDKYLWSAESILAFFVPKGSSLMLS